jgi:hypothetical protein
LPQWTAGTNAESAINEPAREEDEAELINEIAQRGTKVGPVSDLEAEQADRDNGGGEDAAARGPTRPWP